MNNLKDMKERWTGKEEEEWEVREWGEGERISEFSFTCTLMVKS